LCDRCNKVLGLVHDDYKLLHKMAKYLERSGGKINGCKTEQASFELVCGP
jgi:hypothetical protein